MLHMLLREQVRHQRIEVPVGHPGIVRYERCHGWRHLPAVEASAFAHRSLHLLAAAPSDPRFRVRGDVRGPDLAPFWKGDITACTEAISRVARPARAKRV